MTPALVRVQRRPDIDREFLPAELDIVETPRSPGSRAVAVSIAAMLASALALTYFGYMSDYIDVPAKIQAIGRTRVIEPQDAGQIIAIKANDGDRVGEGDVLLELDPTDALADRTMIANQIFGLRAQIAREGAEISVAHQSKVDPSITIDWPDTIPVDIREREARVLSSDLKEFAAVVNDLIAHRRAAVVTQDNVVVDIAAERSLLDVTSEHSAMNTELGKSGWNSELKVLQVNETLETQRAVIAKLEAGLLDAQAAVAVIDSEIAKTRETFAANATDALASANDRLDTLSQHLVKADRTLSHMTLRSPLSGIVHASAVTTIGQVVKPSQQLMEIVPEGAPLELIGYVNNADVGFIKTGQRVEIELDTFPYATYGTIPGVVTSVSRDALPADSSKNTEQSAALDGSIVAQSVAQKTGNIVFAVTVQAKRNSIRIGGRDVQLKPGMAASIDMKTEDRRSIDYLLSPLVDVLSTAAHEQ
jgi:hemolysin D